MTTSRLAQARAAVRPALKARLMISGPTGPGDLPARTRDPQTETPGGCQECDGAHPTSRCPAVARDQRRTRKEHAA